MKRPVPVVAEPWKLAPDQEHSIKLEDGSVHVKIVTVRQHQIGAAAFLDDKGELVRDGAGNVVVDDSKATIVWDCDVKGKFGNDWLWLTNPDGTLRAIPGDLFSEKTVVKE